MGVGGMALHQWAFATPTFRKMMGREGGEAGVGEDFAARGFRKCRRVDSGAQYVRAGTRAVAERELGRLVG